MAKHLEVFYKSENDAEGARAKINSLKTNHVLVEEIPQGLDDKMFVPFMGSGDMATSTTTGVTPVAPAPMESDDQDGKSVTLTHFLQFEVDEEDYQKAVDILKKTNGYIDKSNSI